MDPNTYYQMLLNGGQYSPAHAQNVVQAKFPGWQPGAAPSVASPTNHYTGSGQAPGSGTVIVPPPGYVPGGPPVSGMLPPGAVDPATGFLTGTVDLSQTPTSWQTGNEAGPPAGQSIDAFLLDLLNRGVPREQALQQAAERFGLQQGQDGYPVYYGGNNTIGLADSYLTYENGQWKAVPRGQGGPNNGANGFQIDPTYLQPFTQPAPQFQAPGEFQAPTADSILQDPSYTFRRDQAVDVLQKTKAAQGLYNSGGTVYDLGNLASNFAGTEYGRIWDRDFGLWNQKWNNAINTNSATIQDYTTARDTFYANQNNPYNKLYNVAQLGAGAAANAG